MITDQNSLLQELCVQLTDRAITYGQEKLLRIRHVCHIYLKSTLRTSSNLVFMNLFTLKSQLTLI